ncbi:MAG TPA: hypothetical protein VMD05_08005 [Candidatus Nanoarchaeia archaeon]|nr:hypothetical protein [Candidatus Nanoarchaeia archaeon]
MISASVTFDLWRIIFDPAIIIALIGTFWRQAYIRGYFKKEVEDLRMETETLKKKLECHDSDLSEAAGNFKEISAKLENLKENTREIKESITEIRNFFYKMPKT